MGFKRLKPVCILIYSLPIMLLAYTVDRSGTGLFTWPHVTDFVPFLNVFKSSWMWICNKKRLLYFFIIWVCISKYVVFLSLQFNIVPFHIFAPLHQLLQRCPWSPSCFRTKCIYSGNGVSIVQKRRLLHLGPAVAGHSRTLTFFCQYLGPS